MPRNPAPAEDTSNRHFPVIISPPVANAKQTPHAPGFGNRCASLNCPRRHPLGLRGRLRRRRARAGASVERDEPAKVAAALEARQTTGGRCSQPGAFKCWGGLVQVCNGVGVWETSASCCTGPRCCREPGASTSASDRRRSGRGWAEAETRESASK
ncbi:hypothetical protein GGTG_03631 [Gaeumannomyces tritici R3-111a-1]|uniref:Uncharacterized protein n=1 Tax=Gaeumannomyces tritici (strain R3-111a-1) TaxID=644352 RepID=J3NQS5_GAET3|nr:hypothetical protein GGTG_03631 [Gaeumannomyces tritici R3-111a-1]EJT78531.1 hypothetical protein GGTG_03631 [Gaeumannomyces tritici R3-111a-1]